MKCGAKFPGNQPGYTDVFCDQSPHHTGAHISDVPFVKWHNPDEIPGVCGRVCPFNPDAFCVKTKHHKDMFHSAPLYGAMWNWHNETHGDPVAQLLMSAARTRQERAAVYGERGHVMLGATLKALLPNGVKLETADDFARWSLFQMVVGKLARYAGNYHKGGHKDSLHDLQVYAAMLEAEDDSRA